MAPDTVIKLKQATIAQNDHLVMKDVNMEVSKGSSFT